MQTPKTTLWIPPHIYSELMFYAWSVDAEVGGYGRLSFDNEKNDILVHEIFLVKQEVHQTECNLKAEGTASLYQELIDKGEPEKLGDISLWWHSHKNMVASFSTIDDELMRTWPGNYLVSLVLNRDGKMSAQLMTKTPLLVVGDIGVGVNWFDVENAEKWGDDIKKKITKISPVPIKPNLQCKQKSKQNSSEITDYYGWGGIYKNWRNNGKKSSSVHDMTEDEWEDMQVDEWQQLLEEYEDEAEKISGRKTTGCK